MSDVDRKRRLFRLQKMRNEKAKRDLAVSTSSEQAISTEREAIIAMISDGCIAERLFPKVTYDRLRKLEYHLVAARKRVGEDVHRAFSEKQRLEKFGEAVRDAVKNDISRAENLEQTELTNARATTNKGNQASGKISDLE